MPASSVGGQGVAHDSDLSFPAVCGANNDVNEFKYLHGSNARYFDAPASKQLGVFHRVCLDAVQVATVLTFGRRCLITVVLDRFYPRSYLKLHTVDWFAKTQDPVGNWLAHNNKCKF